MTPRKHSLLARRLIEACGGLEEAAGACRLGKSSLGNAQNPNMEAFLPADVVTDLESYCGQPVYSRALLDASEPLSGTGDLVGEAIDLNARAATLSSHVHHAWADKTITPNEADDLNVSLLAVKRAIARIEADLNAAEIGGTS